MTTDLELPLLAEQVECRGCGACCMHVGNPPGYPPDLSFLDNPDWGGFGSDDAARLAAAPAEALKALTDHFEDYGYAGSDGPCCWLDESTRTCRWYEHRPRACRDFEVGGDGCREMRVEAAAFQMWSSMTPAERTAFEMRSMGGGKA